MNTLTYIVMLTGPSQYQTRLMANKWWKYLLMRNIFYSDSAHYPSPGVLLTEESRGVQVVPRALIGPRSLIEKQNQLEI